MLPQKIEISTEKYHFSVARDSTPAYLHSFNYGSPTIETIDFHLADTEYDEYFFVSASRQDGNGTLLVVSQCFNSHGNIFNPGILYIPETDILFIGAGERSSAFRLDPCEKLWIDGADTGFWSWARFGDYVVMSAELELAAWRITGEKLWTTFVEPPWEYKVVEGQVNLDVMGNKTTFSLEAGPRL